MKTTLICVGRLSLDTGSGRHIGTFEVMEDGFFYFFPAIENRGGYDDYHLRQIADMLQELNREWSETVANELERLNHENARKLTH